MTGNSRKKIGHRHCVLENFNKLTYIALAFNELLRRWHKFCKSFFDDGMKYYYTSLTEKNVVLLTI